MKLDVVISKMLLKRKMKYLKRISEYTKYATIASIIFMVVMSVCIIAITFNRVRNDNDLTKSQLEYQKQLTSQIGKTIEINQTYHTTK